MHIYLNGSKWTSPISSNAKYPYSRMEVGDEATVLPRQNIRALELMALEQSVRASAYGSSNYTRLHKGQIKSFTTKKATITVAGQQKIAERVAFFVKRVT